MIYRAYSLLNVKSFEEDERVVEGMATTPTVDRVGDIVEPLGMKYALPMPLLLYHDNKMPVGSVEFAKATKAGIPFRARLPKVTEPGTVKDRVDEAWHSLKYKLIGAVSIGFKALEDGIEVLKGGGLRFTSTEWLELSLVAVPANAEATITNIKSLDDKTLAASGRGHRVVRIPIAGVSAPQRKAKDDDMNIAKQLEAFEAKRLASQARLEEIMTKAADEGRTLETDEEEEYDNLEVEIKSIDGHIKRLKSLEQTQISRAVPVRPTENFEQASQQRGNSRVTVRDNLPPGIEFARYAMCLAHAQGNKMMAYEIAKQRYPDQPRIHNVLKAAGQGIDLFKTAVVAGGSSTHTTWAGPLVQVDTGFAGDFVEFLRPRTILGKFGTNGIPSLRRVPFNVSIPGQTLGGTGYWVGEGQPKPVTKFAFNRTTIPYTKVANIAVLTEELIRFSNPSAEMLVRDALAECLIQKLDADFTDPDVAISAGISPASITNGAAAVVATGTNAAAVRTDVVTLIKKFLTATMYLGNGVWIMPASVALVLSNMVNSLGQPEFPQLSMQGGSFQGMPVIVSDSVGTTNAGSPTIARPIIILMDAQEVWLADDGNVSIDISREASLEMLSDPTNTPTGLGASPNAPTATSMVSMFQTDSVAIRAEREIAWLKRRSAAAQYINNADRYVA